MATAVVPNLGVFTNLGNVPILDFGSDGRWVPGNIENRDGSNAALTFQKSLPHGAHVVPKWIDDS
jgi:hypothetical protein